MATDFGLYANSDQLVMVSWTEKDSDICFGCGWKDFWD